MSTNGGTLEYYSGFIRNLYSVNTISAQGYGYHSDTNETHVADTEDATDLLFRMTDTNKFTFKTSSGSGNSVEEIFLTKNSTILNNSIQTNSTFNINHNLETIASKDVHFNNDVTINTTSETSFVGLQDFNGDVNISNFLKNSNDVKLTSTTHNFIHSSNATNLFYVHTNLVCNSVNRNTHLKSKLSVDDVVYFKNSLQAIDVVLNGNSLTLSSFGEITNTLSVSGKIDTTKLSVTGSNEIVNNATIDATLKVNDKVIIKSVNGEAGFRNADTNTLSLQQLLVGKTLLDGNSVVVFKDGMLEAHESEVISNSLIVNDKLSVSNATVLDGSLSVSGVSLLNASCKIVNTLDVNSKTKLMENVKVTASNSLIVTDTNSIEELIANSSHINIANVAVYNGADLDMADDVLKVTQTLTVSSHLHAYGTASQHKMFTNSSDTDAFNSAVFIQSDAVTFTVEDDVYFVNSFIVSSPSDITINSQMFLENCINFIINGANGNSLMTSFSNTKGGLEIKGNSSTIDMNSMSIHLNTSFNSIILEVDSVDGEVNIDNLLSVQGVAFLSSDLNTSSNVFIQTFNNDTFPISQVSSGMVTISLDTNKDVSICINNNSKIDIMTNSVKLYHPFECNDDLTIEDKGYIFNSISVTGDINVANDKSITVDNESIFNGPFVQNCFTHFTSSTSSHTFDSSLGVITYSSQVIENEYTAENSAIFNDRVIVNGPCIINNTINVNNNTTLKASALYLEDLTPYNGVIYHQTSSDDYNTAILIPNTSSTGDSPGNPSLSTRDKYLEIEKSLSDLGIENDFAIGFEYKFYNSSVYLDTGNNNEYNALLKFYDSASGGHVPIMIYLLSDKKIGSEVAVDNIYGANAITSTTVHNSSDWYSLRMTRTGTELKLYINGSLEATKTLSSNNALGSSDTFRIGTTRGRTQSSGFYIDNLWISSDPTSSYSRNNAIITNGILRIHNSVQINDVKIKHKDSDYYMLDQNSKDDTIFNADSLHSFKIGDVDKMTINANSNNILTTNVAITGSKLSVTQNMYVDATAFINTFKITETSMNFDGKVGFSQDTQNTSVNGVYDIKFNTASNSIELDGSIFSTNSVQLQNLNVNSNLIVTNELSIESGLDLSSGNVATTLSVASNFSVTEKLSITDEVYFKKSAFNSGDLYIGYTSASTTTNAPVNFIINSASSNFNVSNGSSRVDVETVNVKLDDNTIILSKNEANDSVTWNSTNNQVGIFVQNSTNDAVRFVHVKYGAHDATMKSDSDGIWFARESDIDIGVNRNLNFYNNSQSVWDMSINASTSALQFEYGGQLRMKLLPSTV